MAWRPRYNIIASGSSDKTIYIWDINDQTLAQSLTGHAEAVTVVAWDPQSRYLASASAEGAIRIWDFQTSNSFDLKEHAQEVTSLAWHPNGSYVASGSKDHTIKIWAIPSYKCISTLTTSSQVNAVAWNVSGESLASGSEDGTVSIWDKPGKYSYKDLDTFYILLGSSRAQAHNQRIILDPSLRSIVDHLPPDIIGSIQPFIDFSAPTDNEPMTY